MKTSLLSRRRFLESATATAATVSLVPAAVLGRAGETAPNSRLNLAFIGVGSQGLRVMLRFLREPDVQAVAVCDAVESAANFLSGAPASSPRRCIACWGSAAAGNGSARTRPCWN